jgi:SNF2 family DNA or RNA helicase
VGSLAQEDKIIVFCQYKQSIAAFQAAFEGLGIGYVTLTGEDNMKKRQQAIDGFQTDPKKRIFLATIDAAYVAITLTAANYVSFASQPLTPGKMAQAEDRAYRNGQKRGVFVDVPLIPGTLDDAICKLLDHKRAIAGDVMLEANPDEAKQKELEDKAALEAAAACGLIKSGALVKEKQKTMAL